MSGPITIMLDGPRVFVNGALVAEHAVGVTTTREELWAELRLHRIAGHVRTTLRATVASLDHYGQAKPRSGVRDAAARGLVDGLLGLTGEHPYPGVPSLPPEHTPEYRTTYGAGRSLRALLEHLDHQEEGDQ